MLKNAQKNFILSQKKRNCMFCTGFFADMSMVNVANACELTHLTIICVDLSINYDIWQKNHVEKNKFRHISDCLDMLQKGPSR